METSERNIEANMNELIGRIEAKYEKMSKGQKRLADRTASCQVYVRKYVGFRNREAESARSEVDADLRESTPLTSCIPEAHPPTAAEAPDPRELFQAPRRGSPRQRQAPCGC